MTRWTVWLAGLLATAAVTFARAEDAPLKFGVGLFQPDRDKNDATYRPLAEYLGRQLGRKVVLFTVDSWEGLAKSLANGETDMALMGPWGYVLANHESGARVVSTILYGGKPEYFAIMVTHPDSGIRSIADLKGRDAVDDTTLSRLYEAKGPRKLSELPNDCPADPPALATESS